MPIEIEIGFKLTSTLVKERLINDVAAAAKSRGAKTIAMTAEYYDTLAHSLSAKGATLRRRLEDDEPFVSLKVAAHSGGLILERDTWECPCPEVSTALGTLMDMGAPKEIIDALSSEGFVAYGRYEYTRNSYLLFLDDETSVEVNFDEGVILSEEKQAEFSEVLFKLLFGSKETLEEYVFALEKKHELVRVLSSKYERVLRLIRSR